MKKISLVGRLADQEQALQAVQKAGVFHVQIKARAESRQELPPSSLVARRNKYQQALNLIGTNKGPGSTPSLMAASEAVNTITHLHSKLLHAHHDLERINSWIEKLAPFGEFDLAEVEHLRSLGLHAQFYLVAEREWRNFDKSGLVFQVNQQDAGLLAIFIMDNKTRLLPWPPQLIPGNRLSELIRQQADLRAKCTQLELELTLYSNARRGIEAAILALNDEIQFVAAQAEFGHSNSLFILTGYIPHNAEDQFHQALSGLNVVLKITQPSLVDDPPVLLDNNRLFASFEGILKSFSGISYREKDITWTIGILFVVFGSLCLLDAGYGLMLAAAGGWLEYQQRNSLARVFMVTGVFSCLLGLLSGQMFGFIVGQDFWLGSAPVINLATHPLSCFIFSLVVGMAAMILSYAVAIWQRGVFSPATGGLLCALSVAAFSWTLFSPSYASSALGWLLLSSCVLAWIRWPDPVFGEEKKIANIMWTIYSGATGLIQDVLSHMRLFGIALSGSILALVVNKIALMFAWPLAIVFSLAGHILVFFLALLSLYIHTNRLIFLEFGQKCLMGGHNFYTPLIRSSPV